MNKKITPTILSLLLLLASSCSFTESAPSVTREERSAELALWRKLGASVPDEGFISEFPYQFPLSSKSLLVPTNWHYMDLPKFIRASELRKDLRILKQVMAHAYGGWEVAAQRGVNWDVFFADWDKTLEPHSSLVSLDYAFAPWFDLRNLHLDNHSGIWRYSSSLWVAQTFLFDETPKLPCDQLLFTDGELTNLAADNPATQPRRRKILTAQGLSEAWIATYPSQTQIAQKIRCGNQWIKGSVLQGLSSLDEATRLKQIHRLANLEADSPVIKSLTSDVAYYRAPTGTATNLAEMSKVEIPQRVADAKILIVDLRSNDGGGDTTLPVYAWLGLPANADSNPFGSRNTLTSCLFHSMRLGAMQVFLGRKPSIHPGMQSWMQSTIDAIFDRKNISCDRELSSTNVRAGYETRAPLLHPTAGKRLLLLVDNNCASECELALLRLSTLPASVSLGQNTAGAIEFTQPGHFVFPHTKIPFRVALGHYKIFQDGRSVDGYGLDVDVVIKPETLDDQQIIKFARSLIVNANPHRP